MCTIKFIEHKYSGMVSSHKVETLEHWTVYSYMSTEMCSTMEYGHQIENGKTMKSYTYIH